MARTPSPPPPYSSAPPSMAFSRADSISPPPSYATNPPVPFKPPRAATTARIKDRSERTPLLARGRGRNGARGVSAGLIRATRPAQNASASTPGILLVHVLLCLTLTVGIIFLIYSYYARTATKIPEIPIPTYNVAIIGAGPAGIAAAWHLRTSPAVRGVKLNITLYESKPILGGVLALHGANRGALLTKGDPTQGPITAEDIAGTALMWNNELFTRDSEKALKDEVDFIELGSEQIGYYKNEHRMALAVRPYKKMPLGTWLRLIWSYGGSVWRANKLAQDGKLGLSKAPLISNVEEIIRSVGFLGPLKLRADEMLKNRDISEKYAAEILEPQVQRAYGQNLTQVTGLAAMLAAAQEQTANVYMGGALIERLQRIVDEIDLDVRTSTRVTGVKHVETTDKKPMWLIQHESTEEGGDGNFSTDVFDKVIMSAFDMKILIENSDGVALNLTSYYENDTDAIESAILEKSPAIPVHITFFTSETKLSSWHGEGQVLFINGKQARDMRELALVREILDIYDNTTRLEYLYRVFSASPILDQLQNHAKITWSYETTIDQAYPVLFPRRESFPPFELPWAKGFWWSSIIHRAGATVDLSWLAGKVVAEALIKEVVVPSKRTTASVEPPKCFKAFCFHH
ncbi:hypothetical protein GGR50DRAFT_678012 [Xylaria sp. CBS 124048]|nr:hypothetical protein GGR50DRAFT_678012 [Xylaria sp. CBS 124048]